MHCLQIKSIKRYNLILILVSRRMCIRWHKRNVFVNIRKTISVNKHFIKSLKEFVFSSYLNLNWSFCILQLLHQFFPFLVFTMEISWTKKMSNWVYNVYIYRFTKYTKKKVLTPNENRRFSSQSVFNGFAETICLPL